MALQVVVKGCANVCVALSMWLPGTWSVSGSYSFQLFLTHPRFLPSALYNPWSQNIQGNCKFLGQLSHLRTDGLCLLGCPLSLLKQALILSAHKTGDRDQGSSGSCLTGVHAYASSLLSFYDMLRVDKKVKCGFCICMYTCICKCISILQRNKTHRM